MTTATAQESQGTVLGHPKGLFILFFAEMWERMSYYGMRALLVLYMTKYLLIDQARAAEVLGFNALKSVLEMGFGPLDIQPFASQIYGLYTGFVFLSPFFGGILADRVWGKKKTVYIGGVLMAIGHFLMAYETLFLPALFFLIMGNGAFKPNISTQVGNLYPEGDSRRDGAFTIFYMGINLGAFFSPFLCKDLAVWICKIRGITEAGAAWHLGFTFAGIGMLLGLIVYHMGRKLLPQDPALETLPPPSERTTIAIKTILGFLFCVVGFLVFLMIPAWAKLFVGAVLTAYIVFAIKKVKDVLDRKKVAALVILCVATIAFWAIFEQQGNTLQIWADDKANFDFFHLESTAYQSFNPLFIFAFAPLLDMWWNLRARQGKKPSSSVRKMAIGSFFAGFAFLVMALASDYITVEKSLINMFWLALTTWIFTMGELYLSPIGLSFVTKVAPKYLMSMMMGMWFLSSFAGNYLSGYLGSFYSTMTPNAFFMMFAVLGGAVGLFFLLAEKKMNEAIGGNI